MDVTDNMDTVTPLLFDVNAVNNFKSNMNFSTGSMFLNEMYPSNGRLIPVPIFGIFL